MQLHCIHFIGKDYLYFLEEFSQLNQDDLEFSNLSSFNFLALKVLYQMHPMNPVANLNNIFALSVSQYQHLNFC